MAEIQESIPATEEQTGIETTVFTDGVDRNDSLATLLPSHPAQRSTVTVWTLSNDNPSNTKILDSSNRALYDIKPDFEGSRTMTNMRRMNADGTEGEVFAFLEWHDYTPDKISFQGGKKIRKSTFFSSAGPMTLAVTFTGQDGKKYTWKGVGAGLNLALYAPDSVNMKIPIAQFSRGRYDRSTDPPTFISSQLYLAPRAVEIKEEVLFTFLVLEKNRRTKEASEGNRMDSWKGEAGFNTGKPSIGDGVGPGVKRR